MIKLFQSKQKEEKNFSHLAHEAFFNELRREQYNRLDTHNQTYLDYTGGNVYSKGQLKAHYEMLSNNVFGNPHSTNPTSQYATHLVEEARQKVLDYFNAEDYFCVFTPNASGALKIVGEGYPFCENSHFLLLSDNHNSVNGIREFCKNKKSGFTYAPIQYEDLQIDAEELAKKLNQFQSLPDKLFAFPAQSNVSGVKHDLGWVKLAQDKGWDVLLDAAAFAPTSRLDLKKIQPDFVSLSFYKIFGYPTGIGCLLIKKTKFEKLQKPWFAGGTVTAAAVRSPHHFLTDDHERFEDGTLNYLDIPALKIGLDYIESIGIDRINERVQSLRSYLYNKLISLRHSNGTAQVKIFGPKNQGATGGTLIMTFYNPNGSQIYFEDLETLANKKEISIRSGCFCNPGLDEVNSCVTTEELTDYFSSRDRGDFKDMLHFLAKMRGATRVSVGIATIKKDLDTFLGFVKTLQNVNVSEIK